MATEIKRTGGVLPVRFLLEENWMSEKRLILEYTLPNKLKLKLSTDCFPDKICGFGIQEVAEWYQEILNLNRDLREIRLNLTGKTYEPPFNDYKELHLYYGRICFEYPLNQWATEENTKKERWVKKQVKYDRDGGDRSILLSSDDNVFRKSLISISNADLRIWPIEKPRKKWGKLEAYVTPMGAVCGP